MLDGLHGDKQACCFEILNCGLAAFVAIHALIFRRYILVHTSSLRQNIEHGEIVTAADFKVVEVMGRRDLHATRSKLTINVFVRNDRNFTISEREFQHLADKRLVAFVFRMNRNGLVTKQRLWTGRCNDDAF